jgi:hypothetical protein
VVRDVAVLDNVVRSIDLHGVLFAGALDLEIVQRDEIGSVRNADDPDDTCTFAWVCPQRDSTIPTTRAQKVERRVAGSNPVAAGPQTAGVAGVERVYEAPHTAKGPPLGSSTPIAA